MDTRFWDKTALYRNVDRLRFSICSGTYHSPINAKSFAKEHIDNLIMEELPFPSSKICGILYKGNRSTSIALNSNRTPQMQNFDCMHELMHYYFHDLPQSEIMCFDGANYIRLDPYVEWQANEGAAQFLVPYQDFIPRFAYYLHSGPVSYGIMEILADHYQVSPQVINNRVSSLSYEIDQYERGVKIEDIRLLSRRRQQQLGIHPTCYGAVLDFSLSWDSAIG